MLVTDDFPPPLVGADCDLRNFPFMPLHVQRLRDSDVAMLDDAEAFRAAVLLWCAAWHQVPAGSLPDDDSVLCRLAGLGRDRECWSRLRGAGALHGFVLCSDGRLYHATISEEANKAWMLKSAHRDRTSAARLARTVRRHDPVEVDVTEAVTVSVTELQHPLSVVCHKNDRTGQDKDNDKTRDGEEQLASLASTHPEAAAPQGEHQPIARSKLARATAIPQDWEPDEIGLTYAAERGVPGAQIEQFRNYHTAKGSRMIDWSAAWRTWCGNAVQFGQASGHPAPPVLASIANPRGESFTPMSGAL